MVRRFCQSITLPLALMSLWISACASPYPGWPDPPPRTGLLTDYGGVFDSASKQRVESLLLALQETSEIEFLILTVPSIGWMSTADYTYHLLSKWDLETGMVLVVVLRDGNYHFANSPDMQSDLPPDGGREIAQRSLDLYGPAKGIERFVNLIIDSLEKSRGFSLSRSGAGNLKEEAVIKTAHYSFEIPAAGSWSVEEPGGPSDLVVLTKQLGAASHARTLVQMKVMRNVINERELVELSARENADNIRNLEKQIMLEQGVKPGLYQLHDVSMGEEAVSGRQFYFMDYRTETATDLQSSSLYLFFPKARNNEWFIMAHYTEVAPKEVGSIEYSKADLMDVLRTLKVAGF